MKIDFISEDKFIIFLNKTYYTFDRSTIESCLSRMLKRLKKIYNIEVYSTFNVECYINNNYGIILVIDREYDQFNMYSRKTNLNVKFYDDTLFLYEVSDYFLKDRFEGSSIYKYKNKLYLDIKDNVLDIIEHVNSIIYGDDALKIING